MTAPSDLDPRNRNLAVSYRPLASLIPYARNPRTHNEEQVAEIAASIRAFGWTNPILVDGDNGIIAGHGRVHAARKLGKAKVPVIELAGLSDPEKRAYIIADNKLALNAGWDEAMLAAEIGDLQALGFDLALTGFELAEIRANDLHPTMKPVALVERAIRNSSKTRDTVLDPFAGSGTTVMAAEATGRHAALIELDPAYCDVIVKRWQEGTGKRATRQDGSGLAHAVAVPDGGLY